MDILRDRDVPPSPDLRFIYETSWSALTTGVVLLAAVAGVAGYLTSVDAWQSTWAIVGFAVWTAVMALPIWLSLRTFRASRRRDSWRLAWTPDRLFLRFRSFQNHGFDPETPSVVAIPRRETAWIGRYEQALETQDEDGAWSGRVKIKGLQIKLKTDVETTPLPDALKAEAARRDRKGARFNHYPVAVSRDGSLRVEIKRPDALLHPLRLYYTVAADMTVPLRHFRDMTHEEKEDHILELVLAGRQIDAIKAAREIYGYDLAEAKELVDGLAKS